MASRALRIRVNAGPRAQFAEVNSQLGLVQNFVDLAQAIVAPSMTSIPAHRVAGALEVPIEERDGFVTDLVQVGGYDLPVNDQILHLLTIMAQYPSLSSTRSRIDPMLVEDVGDKRPIRPILAAERRALSAVVARAIDPQPGALRVSRIGYRNPLDVQIVQGLQDLASTWQAQGSAAFLLLAGIFREIRLWQLRGADLEAKRLQNRSLI